MKGKLYVVLTTVGGILFSYGTHALPEIAYLAWVRPDQVVWTKHLGRADCALPEYIQYSLLGLGTIVGLGIGLGWYRISYMRAW